MHVVSVKDVAAAFCQSLNQLFAENCTPSFLKCLDVTLTLLTDGSPGGRRKLGPDDAARSLGTNTYSWTSVVQCGQACPAGKRISGGGRRDLAWATDDGIHRMLVNEPNNDYTDFCICPEGGSPSGTLPDRSAIQTAIASRLGGDIVIIFTEDDPELGKCERDDTVTELISVQADLSGCQGDIATDFCDELIASFNELSAELCDPDYRKIINCTLVASPENRRRLKSGHRRLGGYSYNVQTSGRNSRVGGGGRRLVHASGSQYLDGVGDQDSLLVFGKRLLNDDPIEQCKCVSDNPTFELVTLIDWTEELETVLRVKCDSANVTSIAIEGYPVPCDTGTDDCIIQFVAEFDCDEECPSTSEIEEFFELVYDDLMQCDYLGRNSISISFDFLGEGLYHVTIGFNCVDGCDILPGEPSIFDESDTVLLSECGGGECPARAPTIDEFITRWNDIINDEGTDFPTLLELVSLKPVGGTGECVPTTTAAETTTEGTTTAGTSTAGTTNAGTTTGTTTGGTTTASTTSTAGTITCATYTDGCDGVGDLDDSTPCAEDPCTFNECCGSIPQRRN